MAMFELINCYSVGTVTGNTDVGGFIGKRYWNDNITVNCSWDINNAVNAIGDYDWENNPLPLLVTEGYGTDEDDHTDFYSIAHIVYDQGNPDAWDFATPVWYEWSDRYPLFTEEPEQEEPMTDTNGDAKVSLMTTFVDGLDHLEGKTVAILADGNVLPQQVVVSGEVTLDRDYAKVHVGLPYVAEMETLNIEVGLADGTLQGRKVKISQLGLRLLNSRGGHIGPDKDTIHAIRYPSAVNPLLLVTNDAKEILGSGYTEGGRIYLRQSDPLPITVLALIPVLTPGGTTAE